MSAPTVKFLIELLEGGENAIEALEIQLSSDADLEAGQRTTLLNL